MPPPFRSQSIINFRKWVLFFGCMYVWKWPIPLPFSSQSITNFRRWVAFVNVYNYDWKWLSPFPPNPSSNSESKMCFVGSCMTGSDQCLSIFPHNPSSISACELQFRWVNTWLEVTNVFLYWIPFHHKLQEVSCVLWVYVCLEATNTLPLFLPIYDQIRE